MKKQVWTKEAEPACYKVLISIATELPKDVNSSINIRFQNYVWIKTGMFLADTFSKIGGRITWIISLWVKDDNHSLLPNTVKQATKWYFRVNVVGSNPSNSVSDSWKYCFCTRAVKWYDKKPKFPAGRGLILIWWLTFSHQLKWLVGGYCQKSAIQKNHHQLFIFMNWMWSALPFCSADRSQLR